MTSYVNSSSLIIGFPRSHIIGLIIVFIEELIDYLKRIFLRNYFADSSYFTI